MNESATTRRRMDNPERQMVYDAIDRERALQDRKWGGPPHDDQRDIDEWCASLWKHTRKAFRATSTVDAMRHLVEVAALAVAAIESGRRLGVPLGPSDYSSRE